jgi:hypothetical protein
MKIRAFITFLTINVFLLCAPFDSSWAVSPGQDDLESVRLEASKGGYRLIDVDTLWAHYQKDQDNLLLVDTRQEWEYHAGYIKGALNFSMEPTWLARMIQRGAFEQFLGPDKTKTLVFY